MRRTPNPNSPEEVRKAIQLLNRDTISPDGADYIQFNTEYADGSAVGKLQWNSEVGTLEFGLPGGEVNLQIGQEFLIPIRNITGDTLLNGRLVYYTGADEGLSTVDYADATRANWPKALVRGILTEDVENGTNGYMLMAGVIHDVNTLGYTPGIHLYLTTTGDGTFTNTRPTAPDYVMGIGTVKEADATVGTIQIEFDRLWDLEWASNVQFSPPSEEGQYLGWHPPNDRYELQRSQRAFFNGTFRETFDALMYSTDGVDLFLTLERAGGAGGDLTMQFSDGDSTLDCTPAQEEAITPGTDAAPTGQVVYIPQSTKALAVASEWPDDIEHIKIAYLFVPSAQFVFDHGGPYVNQNYNDHLHGTDLQGHLSHIATKIRGLGAGWHSGVGPDGVDVSYFTYPGVGDNNSDIRWESTAGLIAQLHPQVFDAQDTASTILIVTNGTTPYQHIQNLFTGITETSLGATITNNKYFSLVFWGVANKTGDANGIMCNLPAGFYTTEINALVDATKYDDYSFPRQFDVDSSTAFLICRSTFRMGSAGWTHIQTEDLRGVSGAGGGAVSAITDHGGLGGLTDDDHNTGVSAYHTDTRAATWLAANHETTYNHANFATAFGWGNHSGLYDPAGTMTTHESTYNHTQFATAYGWGDHGIVGYLTSETSHADVLVDGDFASQGIMLRGAGAGTYSILTDASANWNTAFGWGDHGAASYHTDATAATWLAAGHETTYDHTLIGSGGSFGNDEELKFGDGSGFYWFVYNSSSTQFELWSTNVDGVGTDGLVLSVDDGTDDVSFEGIVNSKGINSNAVGAVDALVGTAVNGAGINGTSSGYIGVLGQSTASNAIHAISVSGTGVYGTSGTGRAGYFYRKNAGGAAEVLHVFQDETTDSSHAVVIRQDGAGDILRLTDNVNVVARFKDGGGVDITGDMDVTGVLTAGSISFTSPAIGDDVPFDIGDAPDYWFVYNSTGTQYEFWSTDVGSGVDGLIFSVDDGDSEVQFAGIVRSAGMAGVGTGGATGTSGTSGSGKGLHGISTSGDAVHGDSGSGYGVYGTSDSNFCGYFYRNASGASANVVRVHQAHAANTTSTALAVYQTGTGSICEMYDGAVLVVDFKDGGDVDFTNIVKAGGYKSSDGTAGWTGSIPNTFTSITVKNGLITGYV